MKYDAEDLAKDSPVNLEIKIPVRLPPEEMAKLWGELSAEEQAKFFAEIVRLAREEWEDGEISLDRQICWIINKASEDALIFLDLVAQYREEG
jgi:hypothetical protein